MRIYLYKYSENRYDIWCVMCNGYIFSNISKNYVAHKQNQSYSLLANILASILLVTSVIVIFLHINRIVKKSVQYIV